MQSVRVMKLTNHPQVVPILRPSETFSSVTHVPSHRAQEQLYLNPYPTNVENRVSS